MISRIVLSAAERAAGEFNRETIEQASRSFRLDGALIIEDIVDATIVTEARRAFIEAYSRYLDVSEHENAAKVGLAGGCSSRYGSSSHSTTHSFLPIPISYRLS